VTRAQTLRAWGIPFITIGSGELVPREHATRLIESVYLHGYIFYGYEAFTVFPDGKGQPHLEFSASFSKQKQRTLAEALASLQDDPVEITHYEFSFEPHAC
jgi:hypothetical protein